MDLDEHFKLFAQQMDRAVKSLHNEGFSREEALKLICASLSGTQVFLPLAEDLMPTPKRHQH